MDDTVKGIVIGTLLTGTFQLASQYVDWYSKSREMDIRMVDVALTILSGKTDSTNNNPAKLYALRLLEQSTGLPIEDKDAWLDKDVPVGDWPAFSSYCGKTCFEKLWSTGLIDKQAESSKKPASE